MGEEPLDEVKRRMQDQTSIIQRLQFELETHIKEMQPFMQNFYKFVMDPVEGLVVKHRHLERSVASLDQALAADLATVRVLDAIPMRISALEKAQEEAKTTRQWVWKDVLIPTAMSAGIAILGAYLTIKFAR